MAQEALFELVKNYLISQGMKPGDTIDSEVLLAKRFGVTRHSMRNVLGAMAQAGILERTPRRGTVIKNFDSGTLSDHIRFQFEVAHFNVAGFKEARIIIERAILPLAIKRMTAVQMDELEKIIDRMLEFLETPEKADTYDKDFHLHLYQACGNEVLSSFSGLLTTLFKSADYRRQYWTRERIERIANEHRIILEAIRRGDVRAAVAALDIHLGFAKLNIAM